MYTLFSFYRSDEWRDLVEYLKVKRMTGSTLLCEHCGKPIVKKYDCIGHHWKTELTEQNVNDASISLNPENVLLVHRRCHDQIHSRFGFESRKKVYLIYGAPCSGKSEYVKSIAGPNDLVVDMDNIYQMISVSDRWTNTQRLRQCAFAVRDLLLDMVKHRTGKWQNAYIIGGYPLLMDRVRLCDSLGAEMIYIEETQEQCTIEALRRGITQRYVDEWFERFQKG